MATPGGATQRPQLSRGGLRIYLGAAPGVGKTYAMLGEAHRRSARGTDTVVGLVEAHGRRHTCELVDGLEVVPRRTVPYRGTQLDELDVDAVLARRPQVVCVDELAHTNVPGSRHPKRWQDVEELRAAGITVLTTLNVSHLESLADVVERITGTRPQETIPDSTVRGADQVELVDLTPEALRRRLAHGNIYPTEQVDAALGRYFRVGNLTALRELALLWLAGEVEEKLQEYRREHAISETWQTRERVVVAIPGGRDGAPLVRRAARIAAHGSADLLGVHVARPDGLAGASPAELAAQRRLLEELGGSYHELIGEAVPAALVQFARAENATQLVLGAPRRRRWPALLRRPGVGATTVRLAGAIDVHVVAREGPAVAARLPQLSGGLTRRRHLLGTALAVVVLPLATVTLSGLRSQVNLVTDLLVYLLAVVGISVVGGAYPGIGAAVAATVLLNYYFTPPLHRWTVADHGNVVALVAFVVVAATVSAVVELAARRTAQAARAGAESQTLATLAGSVLRGQATLETLLERLREALSLTAVTLLERGAPGREDWSCVASVGTRPSTTPEDGDARSFASENLAVVVRGERLAAHDQRLVTVFAVQAAVMLEQLRLTEQAEAARPLAEADRMRTALLTAVSHDLRSPLASATAAIESLSSTDVDWTPAQRLELVATARESLHRLTRLVENLLGLSRLQAGALSVRSEPTRLDEVMPLALDTLGVAALAIEVDLPAALPEVAADPALLEHVIANLVSNALRFAGPDTPPRLAASAYGDRVELRVVDHGPGIPAADREQIFTPFQRLGDTDNTTGLGLGLALARGLTEAMGGRLTPEDTPGGGLTMVVELAAADPGWRPRPGRHDEALA